MASAMAVGASVVHDRPWELGSSIATATMAGEAWPYIDTGGKGQVLIMLPGSVGTCEMFYKQIAALGQKLRIVSVSYPALSDPSRLADGLADLMDHLGLPRASILGSSFGGYWAQFFALRHPGRLDHLFLGNIFLSPDELFANPLFDPAFIAATQCGRAAGDLAQPCRTGSRQRVEGDPARHALGTPERRQSEVSLRGCGGRDALPCTCRFRASASPLSTARMTRSFRRGHARPSAITMPARICTP